MQDFGLRFWRTTWRLMKPYWRSEEKARAIALLIFIITLNLAGVFLLVKLNYWNNDFYNALQNRDFDAFTRLIGDFSLLAFSTSCLPSTRSIFGRCSRSNGADG